MNGSRDSSIPESSRSSVVEGVEDEGLDSELVDKELETLGETLESVLVGIGSDGVSVAGKIGSLNKNKGGEERRRRSERGRKKVRFGSPPLSNVSSSSY